MATPLLDRIRRQRELAERQARSIHDEEVNAMRERVAATWVQRAMAGTLPAKEYAR